MKTFAIVGAGQAGCSAAMELRRAGFDGRIVLIGDEVHLPYERPPLSKAALNPAGRALSLLQAADVFERERIEVWTGVRAERIDAVARSLQLDNGRTLAYDKLLLATGGLARRLAIPGGEHALTLRTWDDAQVLRERLNRRVGATGHLVVIGAGVIGLEVAASARQMGWSVTVLEFSERPLARLVPEAISRFMGNVHQAAGVVLRMNTGVQAMTKTDDGSFEIRTSHGSLAADLVVAGIGMQAHISLAEQAGAEVDGAVVVDEFGCTSLRHVYAAGDVASFWHPLSQRRMRLESWQHAAQHAQAVARNMLGPATAYDVVPWSWSDQFDINLQIMGQPLASEETVWRGDVASRKWVALHLREGRVVGATLCNMGREMRPCKALIESGAVLDKVLMVDETQPLRSLAASLASTST